MADLIAEVPLLRGAPLQLAAMFAMAGLLATRDYEPDDPELVADAYSAARSFVAREAGNGEG